MRLFWKVGTEPMRLRFSYAVIVITVLSPLQRTSATALAVLVQQSTNASARAPTSFEVASIRPTSPDQRNGKFARLEGAHRFIVRNYTVKDLVAAAYGVARVAVVGGPKWIESDA